MSRIDFIRHHAVKMSDVINAPERKALIEGFCMERSINIIWAPAGSGKTNLMMAVSKQLAAQEQEVVFIDVDNGIDLLKDRGYHTVIEACAERLLYFNADWMDNPQKEVADLMDTIRDKKEPDAYKNCVFILDSLKFFLDGDMYDEGKIIRFINFCKVIRKRGGIVWVLNHSTKKGDTMKGGSGLIDAADECWEMQILAESIDDFNYLCVPLKQRMKVKECGFAVKKLNYDIATLDTAIAKMSEEEKAKVEKITQALSRAEMTQGEIMKLLEVSRGDRASLAILNQHEGRYWQSEKRGKEKFYIGVEKCEKCENNLQNA